MKLNFYRKHPRQCKIVTGINDLSKCGTCYHPELFIPHPL